MMLYASPPPFRLRDLCVPALCVLCVKVPTTQLSQTPLLPSRRPLTSHHSPLHQSPVTLRRYPPQLSALFGTISHFGPLCFQPFAHSSALMKGWGVVLVPLDKIFLQQLLGTSVLVSPTTPTCHSPLVTRHSISSLPSTSPMRPFGPSCPHPWHPAPRPLS
jgi:hypothetical protein